MEEIAQGVAEDQCVPGPMINFTISEENVTISQISGKDTEELFPGRPTTFGTRAHDISNEPHTVGIRNPIQTALGLPRL